MSVTALRLLLARNVRKLRKERQWSQEELGGRTGIHRTYIGAIERGEANLTLDHVQKLAEGLNVSPVTLLSPS